MYIQGLKRTKAAIFFTMLSALFFANLASAGTLRKTTVNYAPHSLTSLDIYTNSKLTNAPVMIYVHGGAWTTGDKARVNSKPAHFIEKGFVFVAVNYRLVPRNTVDDQISDIDRALKWVFRNIAKHGGNPDSLHLMGHSSGAHLVALTATAPRDNTARLIKSGALRTVIANDTRAYNIPDLALLYPVRGLPKLYRNAFGSDPARWRRLSPAYHLNAAKPRPAFLIMYSTQANKKSRHGFALDFADGLQRAGTQVQVFNGRGYSHREINVLIGKPNKITATLDAFLAKHR